MNRVFSCLLLLLFLFNVGGYHLFFWGLRYQTDRELTSRLDANQYHRGETVTLKIPVTLPYPIHSGDFERIDGRFEYNGEHFKLVKHKLQNDTLHVVCIRDERTRELVETMTAYVGLTQTTPATDAGTDVMSLLNKIIKDFFAHADLLLMQQPGYSAIILFVERPELLQETVLPVISPPPRPARIS